MSSPAQALPSANDLLGGSGRKYRSLSFKGSRPPVEYRDLTVLAEPETFHSRDLDSGKLVYWDTSGKTAELTFETHDANGRLNKPVLTFSVKVQLPDGYVPDPDIVDENGEDDGVRYLYFKGQQRDSKSTFDAIATACRTARAKRGLQPGGILRRFAWVAGGEERRGSTKSTRKEYEAEYDPSTEWPAAQSANGQLAAASGGQTSGEQPNIGDDESDEPPF